ncbi:MAG: arsenate reductase ArsC [Chloroflexi bacterium]|nr:MAG: arsenate reductase ArsC [Chloroflexota bacterium]
MTETHPYTRVLVLCTGNSCRSQMAEGLIRHLGGDRFEVYSAGSNPAGYVHPLAVQVMAEIGIDISRHRSKHMNQFIDEPFDYVITVCDAAAEACPVFPGPAQRLHWPFDDPAKAEGSEGQRLAVFRRVRDEIRDQVEAFVARQKAS